MTHTYRQKVYYGMVLHMSVVKVSYAHRVWLQSKKYDVIAALSLVVGTLITTCMSIILGQLEYEQSNLVSCS
jgi:hypothetical protein